MTGSSILEIVPIHRGDDHVREAETSYRLGDPPWLVGIERQRPPCTHVTESACPRARVAHNHEGGVALGPAFPDVRTGGFLTYRDKPPCPHDGARPLEFR